MTTVSRDALISEIAERKKAEKALRASENKYRLLVENIPQKIFIKDRNSVYISCNENFARDLKIKSDEIAGRTDYDFFPKELAEKYRADDQKVMESGKTESIEEKYIQDGREVFVNTIKTPVRDESQNTIGILGIFWDITKHKKAEIALHESEKRFQEIVSNAAEWIWEVDTAGLYTYSSPVVEKLLGYKPEEVVGKKHFYDLFTDQDRDKLKQAVLEDFKQKQSFKGFLIANVHKDGRIVWLMTSGVPILDLDGNLIGYRGSAINITPQVQANEEIKKTQLMLQQIINSMPFGVVVIGRDKIIRRINAAATQISGYKEEEMIGHICNEMFCPPFDKECPILDKKQNFNRAEKQLITKDKKVIPIIKSVVPLKLGDEDVLLEAFIDVSELKKAEKELEKTLQWQQGVNLLQQSLLAPVVLKDKLKNITDSIVRIFDADFCRIWLIQQGDLCDNCVHNEVKEGPHVCSYRDKCLHLLASSGRYTHIDGKTHQRVPFGCYKIGRVASGQDHKFLTNDAQNDPRVHNHQWAKELGLVSFAGYQLRVPGGDVLGVLALFAKHTIMPAEDAMLDGISSAVAFVVQQAIADSALLKSKTDLEQANEQLATAINKLEDTNTELKNFVYIASHDLREPLRKITAFGAMLEKSLKGKLAQDDAENLMYMIDGAQRMTKMIEGLLVYSRVSTQAQPSQNVNLNEIVMQLQQFELSVLIEEKKVTIDAQSLPWVEADLAQLRQLMQNLIANGIKYQKKGNTPHITITSKPAPDGMVRIEITDNGIGIKPEFQGAIFTMFKRLHSREEYEGTGIGLAVCKKIVERHGGKIGVESQPDKGSTFWFTMQVAKSNDNSIDKIPLEKVKSANDFV